LENSLAEYTLYSFYDVLCLSPPCLGFGVRCGFVIRAHGASINTPRTTFPITAKINRTYGIGAAIPGKASRMVLVTYKTVNVMTSLNSERIIS